MGGEACAWGMTQVCRTEQAGAQYRGRVPAATAAPTPAAAGAVARVAVVLGRVRLVVGVVVLGGLDVLDGLLHGHQLPAMAPAQGDVVGELADHLLGPLPLAVVDPGAAEAQAADAFGQQSQKPVAVAVRHLLCELVHQVAEGLRRGRAGGPAGVLQQPAQRAAIELLDPRG